MGYKRAFTYLFQRIIRIRATPHSIACGFAWGAAMSFTPFIGIHILLAMMLSYLTRGNLLASALGTAVGNPITFPPIFAFTYFLGSQITASSENIVLNEHAIETLVTLAENTGFMGFVFHGLIDILANKFIPLLTGGLICLPLIWTGVYFSLKKIIPIYIERHRKKIERKQRKKSQKGIIKTQIESG